MSLVQLYIPLEISREVVYQIGKSGNVQFRDLNKKVNTFQRSFVQEIRRLDNTQRQYRFFKSELDERSIEIKNYDVVEVDDDSDGLFNPVTKQADIDEKVESAQILEERLIQLVDASENLKLRKKDLLQLRYVLNGSDKFFSEAAKNADLISINSNSNDNEGHATSPFNVNFVTGVIPRSKLNILEKILWRSLRGNLYLDSIDIPEPIYDPKSKSFIDKTVFIVFSHGYEIINRIKKICESLDSDLYNISEDYSARSEHLVEVNTNLQDLNTVLETTDRTLESELIAISKELHKWSIIIAKEKSVYESLNLFNYDSTRKALIAEGWIPTQDIDGLQNVLKSNNDGFQSILNILSTTKTPPTFHKTNKFTEAFQNICDAYGVAEYKEVNPGLPTIVTFPFMFAIMFGDLGHGFILSLAALTLVLNEKKIAKIKRDEIFDMAYSGRYILLLMGVFSMFTGFLYNDIFSISMTIFKSGWEFPEHFAIGETVFAKKVGTYAIGLDPAWHGTENALLFTNSYKMKLSILMGFIHMSYSYVFSLVNYINSQSLIDIVGNFIPGLLFMQSIFGYLSICIVYKWSIDWIKINKPAPGLLNMLISMFLSPGTVEEPLYSNQATVQIILLIIALICVPWLLLLKPLYYKRKFAQEAEYQRLNPEPVNDDIAEDEDDDDEEHEEHNFGDIMIHQVIHTIEFCLNSVSHTASYLRLWALSLAHAQLSTVLWQMTIKGAFGMTGITGVLATVFLFGMWFVLTCVILVIMEGTSAMLHSLRLHWVESMSKFFVGGGSPYEPFNFANIISSIEL